MEGEREREVEGEAGRERDQETPRISPSPLCNMVRPICS